MPLFRRKPFPLEAILWSGDNYDEVMVFCGGGSGNIVDLRGETIIIHMRDSPSTTAVKGEWIIKDPTDDRPFCVRKAIEFDKNFEQIPEKCTSCGRNPPEPSHVHFLCMTCIRTP